MKKLILLCLCFLASKNASAVGEWVDVAGFTLWSTFYAADVIRLEVGSPRSNPGGCSNPDSYMVLSTLPEQAKQRIYSSLLAAKMAGEPIRLRLEGCESDRPAVIAAVML